MEEDIKILERFIKQIKTDKFYEDNNGWSGYYNTELKILSQAIENVLEDNQTMRRQLNDAFNRGFIHKEKIKAKIEELEKLIFSVNTKEPKIDAEEYYRYINYVEILKELLESECLA